METLGLILSPINGVKFKVILNGGSEEISSLPFSDGDKDTKLFTILNALNATDSRYQSSESDDQNWMIEEGILSEDKQFFSPTMRQTIGQKLYNALFTQSIQDALNQALGRAGSKSLHIQIQYPGNAIQTSRLSLYPWQLVHNGTEFLARSRVQFSFLIAHNNATVIGQRRVKQIKVLFISSRASEKNAQSLEDKISRINEGLTKAQQEGRACLLSWYDKIKEKPTYRRLQAYLTDYQNEPEKLPNIIHFDGHGAFKKFCDRPGCRKNHPKEIIYPTNKERCGFCNTPLEQPQGFLLFEDEDGTPDYISAKKFTDLVSIGNPDLVVITACRSALAYKSESVFNGIAQSLLQKVPAVVATPFNITQDSTISFIEQFYRSLGARNSLLQAVKLASDSMEYKNYEWYRLVTFLNHRTEENGFLFESDENQALNLAPVTKPIPLDVEVTEPIPLGKKVISCNKYNGQLVSLDLDFFKTCDLNKVIIELNISFGNFDQNFKFEDSKLLFFKRDKEGYIRLGIKGVKLHLKLKNALMPLSRRINKQINTQNCQVIATGDENNPTWIFATTNNQSILKESISNKELGIINLLGNSCVVEGILKCNIDGNDLKIIAQNGVWNNRTSKSKRETKIRVFFKYIEPKLKDYLSKVVWEYDSTRISRG